MGVVGTRLCLLTWLFSSSVPSGFPLQSIFFFSPVPIKLYADDYSKYLHILQLQHHYIYNNQRIPASQVDQSFKVFDTLPHRNARTQMGFFFFYVFVKSAKTRFMHENKKVLHYSWSLTPIDTSVTGAALNKCLCSLAGYCSTAKAAKSF